MEFTSNNLRLHVSTAGDIITTLRFARFRAAPKYKLRPQTLQSAPGPFAEQCSLFGPNGKMFGVSFWASASTQNVATRAFDINSPQLNLLRSDSMNLKGHRLLVKDVDWCYPACRKFEGAHPIKGKAKSTGHKAERYWQVRTQSKNMRSCTKELERVDGRSGLRIHLCGCPVKTRKATHSRATSHPWCAAAGGLVCVCWFSVGMVLASARLQLTVRVSVVVPALP